MKEGLLQSTRFKKGETARNAKLLGRGVKSYASAVSKFRRGQVEDIDMPAILPIRTTPPAVIKDEHKKYFGAWVAPLVEEREVMKEGLSLEFMRAFDREIIYSALDTLRDREMRCLKLYYGLDGEGRYTYDRLGRQFSVSRERARQIICKAIRKLRHSSLCLQRCFRG